MTFFDQFTGLIWEVKSDTEGLHDWRNTYSWYSPDESFGGELDYLDDGTLSTALNARTLME